MSWKTFVDYHGIKMVYPSPRQSLCRGYLKWHIAVGAPMSRLKNPVRGQSILVCFFAGLIY
jgi:hypothetical protein